MLDFIPNKAHKGRGAISNKTGRLEKMTRHLIDDGWTPVKDTCKSVRTEVIDEWPKSIINQNKSPDLPFHKSVNPYRGCEHGCVYCFARPTHAYHGLSSGLDFETKLFAKPNAAALLEAELRTPDYIPEPIAIGTNTDPYQPIEKGRRIMREVLEILDAYNHPVSIVTKSTLVLRDLDILSAMAKRKLISVGISVTTLDKGLARIMEPRAATPKNRLNTIQQLCDIGVPTFCLVAPIIPGLNDHELEAIVEAAVARGAASANYTMLRLPYEIKDLFIEWLGTHQPDRKSKVISMIRETWGGALYVADWETRQWGIGPYSAVLKARMNRLRKRLELNKEKWPGECQLNTKMFCPPPKVGDQLNLL